MNCFKHREQQSADRLRPTARAEDWAMTRRRAIELERGVVSVEIQDAGKRVVAYPIALHRRGAGAGRCTTLRLRFDKVVTRLIDRLQGALGGTVPAGTTVLLTVTAPIRVPSETAASLETKIRMLLRRGVPGRDTATRMCGNRVRIRFSRHESARAPKLIGFAHHAESDPLLLLNLTQELLEGLAAADVRRASRRAGERWLMLIGTRGSACLGAYRQICAQLRMTAGFGRVLMVCADGRVGTLIE